MSIKLLLLASIWRVPVSGGEEVQVVPEIAGDLNFASRATGSISSPHPQAVRWATSRCSRRSPARRPRSIFSGLLLEGSPG